MREQAKQLGMRTGHENSRIARQHITDESYKLMIKTRRENGYYEKDGGYYVGLENRKKNCSFDRFIKSGHTSETIAKRNKAVWNNMTEDERIKFLSKNLNSVPCFRENNNIIEYYDKIDRKYVSWEEYKIKFSSNLNNYNYLNEGIIIPTFLNQDSDTWDNARIPFEQNLVYMNIKWFTYIKFYINKNNNSEPLVAGIYGSKLVNSKTDINFSMKNDLHLEDF